MTSAHSRARRIEITKLQNGLNELRERKFLESSSVVNQSVENDNRNARYELTDAGCDVLRRLVTARRERLAELFGEWSPEKREEIADQLRRIACELVPEVHQHREANPNPHTHQSTT